MKKSSFNWTSIALLSCVAFLAGCKKDKDQGATPGTEMAATPESEEKKNKEAETTNPSMQQSSFEDNGKEGDSELSLISDQKDEANSDKSTPDKEVADNEMTDKPLEEMKSKDELNKDTTGTEEKKEDRI